MAGKLLIMNTTGHSEVELEDRPEVETRLARELSYLSAGRKQFTRLSPQEAVDEVNRMLRDGWVVAYKLDPAGNEGEQIERSRGVKLDEQTLIHTQFAGG